MKNLEESGLQQQKIMSVSTPITQEQDSVNTDLDANINCF